MVNEHWSGRCVVADPERKELNELKLKEFNGWLTPKEADRLAELRKVYK
jgi:hypothetical protein